MNGRYNQPTAHMLQPVKGWDSMAHLDFVAPIAAKVTDALPGTVMHLNPFGELEVGLTAQGMGMYLFYKMWDEDVQPYPLTADGTRMTAVGMQSFGGYNSEVYLRTWEKDTYNTNGHASNVGAYNFDTFTGEPQNAKVKAGASAHTTYPAICGMELSSTEFAYKNGDGTSIQYYPNDCLTAPLPDKTIVLDGVTTNSNPGSMQQQFDGGFLKKGTCYVDPICGIVSKKPVINEHGYMQICFWSTWLPALSTDTAEDDAVLAISNGKPIWLKDESDSTAFNKFFTLMYNTSGNYAPFKVYDGTDITYKMADENGKPFDKVFFVRAEQTNAGINFDELDITATISGVDSYNIGDPAPTGVDVSMVMADEHTVQVNIGKAAENTVTVTFTYTDQPQGATKAGTVTIKKANA